MCENSKLSSIGFFDKLALKWDSLHDLKALSEQLDSGLTKFGVTPDENILDVGCGTGNLTEAIIRKLSPLGKVSAVDLSKVMLDRAKVKVNDQRVNWHCGAVEEMDFAPATFDRIICYSVWPHLTDVKRIACLFHRWLKPGGKLHIWHTISRSAVNRIHSEASAAVNDHLLATAEQTASLLDHCGFSIEEMQDDDAGYLVTAKKV
ncbi:MAG: class I SAM-dependent methyltransferase [Fibrobacter sp.]|nr:class I SAM-dependent methyltransferase [Fibrobacter sp.]